MPCISPFYVKNNRFGIDNVQISKIPVGCGRCAYCIERKVNEWIVRLLSENKDSKTAEFVTFTYNTDHVPITENRFMTLNKKDIQLFFKRLRKFHHKHSGLKIKYYLTGEYGTQKKRPHYHAIIFNAEKIDILRAWISPDTGQPIGELYFGKEVNEKTIAYTIKYMAKPEVHRKKFGRDDREPEFSLMSKGLGLNYITAKTYAYHQADISRNYVTLEGGFKAPLARYLREKIYTEDQRKKQGFQAQKIAEEAEQAHKINYFIRNPNHTEEEYKIFNAYKNENKTKNYLENSCKNRSKV